MKAPVLLLALCLAAVPASRAQLAAGELPELGNLGALITRGAADVGHAPAPDGGREISAGLPAPDDARGAAAAWLAKGLSGGDAEMEKALAGAIEAERENVEKALGERGFVMNDLGVALAMNFVMLWELATGEELGDATALKAGRSLVETFAARSPVDDLEEGDRATALDVLITMPVTYTSLVHGYESNGREAEAGTLREQAGGEFEKLFKLPAALFAIDGSGRIDVDAEAAEAWQAERGIAGGW